MQRDAPTVKQQQIRWTVRFGEAATLVDATSFQLVRDAVWRYFKELLPRGATKSDIAFEGRCFSSPQAPLATVLSEDSLAAFNDACRQFLPSGSMPIVTLLLLHDAPPAESSAAVVPAPAARNVGSPSSPAAAATAAAAPAALKSHRIADRLNNIKRSYGDMYSSSDSAEQQRAAAEVSALAKAKSPSPMKRGPPPSSSDGQRVSSARGELQRYQQELEDAERELREAPRHKTAAPAPAPHREASSSPTPIPLSSPAPSCSSASTVELMAWGMQVRRGVPIPFNPWEPPPLTSLMRQASALLDQPVQHVWYKSDQDPTVEIDVEDDDDVATLAAVVQRTGADHITLYVQNSAKSDGLPVSYVKLKREAKRTGSNRTPLTSPIKDVCAPSPLPGGGATQSSSSASSAAASSKRKDYAKPPPSLVAYLD